MDVEEIRIPTWKGEIKKFAKFEDIQIEEVLFSFSNDVEEIGIPNKKES